MDVAIENSEQINVIDYSKNPRMLYDLLKEFKEEIAPMFIRLLIEQGIEDGSIKTDWPKELSAPETLQNSNTNVSHIDG